jgi:hypothetical protein
MPTVCAVCAGLARRSRTCQRFPDVFSLHVAEALHESAMARHVNPEVLGMALKL